MANKSYNVKTQYGSEATYGTIASSFTSLGRVQSIEPKINNNIIRNNSVGGGRNANSFTYGVLDVELSATFQVSDFNFLQHYIGQIAGSGTAGSKYTLTESDSYAAGSEIEAFSLKVNSDESTDDCDAYLGCIGTDFSLNFEIGKELSVDVNIRAKDVDSTASMTGFAEPSGSPFMVYQATYNWGTGPSEVADIRKLKISMNNNPQIFRSLSSRKISKPETGLRHYDFELDVVMTTTIETEFRDRMYGGTGVIAADTVSTPVTGIELNATFSEGSSTGDRNAIVQLDECVITSISKPVSVGGDVVLLKVSGYAQKGLSNVPITWWTA